MYETERLEDRRKGGVFRYSDWLPVRSTLETEAEPVVFRNEDLAREIGVEDLWIGFTGYYPERNARATACSFKQMEALPTFARLRDCGGGTVIVASAGNTGRAFAETANAIGNPCVVVVPEKSKDRLKVTKDDGMVRLFSVEGDYADAIAVADRLTAIGGFVPEGGARNVARRDGMGTVMLAGALAMGRIPDRYFQAVGSGTGGISAWEASLRLIRDGRFGSRLPRLELAQNEPFVPMAKAWAAGRRSILPEDLGDAERDVASVYADVLTNRRPPYSVAGGVFDAMTACGGSFRTVSNEAAKEAERLWMSYEDVRPDPAASVALASLIEAARNREIGKGERIFLNMTGGGLERAERELGLVTVSAEASLSPEMTDDYLRGVLNA